jgi:hypothetical protein
MKELLTVSLAIVIMTFNLIPLFIVLSALFPARTAKTLEIANRTPGRAFVIGMVNFIFFLVIAMTLFTLAEKVDGLFKAILILPAIVMAVILSIALGLGLVSISNLIGERLSPALSAWKRTFWGTLLLGLGGSVPILGWFLLLPYAAWVGMGAFLLGFFQKTSG